MRAADAPPPGFYAPDPYAAKWLWIGIGALALVAAWYAWVWWSTREKKVVVPPRITSDRLTRLRADYTRQIDLVLDRAAAGEISQRRAHQQAQRARAPLRPGGVGDPRADDDAHRGSTRRGPG